MNRKLAIWALIVVPMFLLLLSLRFYWRPPFGAAILVVCGHVAYRMARGRWAKAGITCLYAVSVALFLFSLPMLLMMRAAYVSAEAISPDATTTAELFELPQFVDRNFQVRLKTYRWKFIPSRRVVFQSPDEGAPPGTERLIWSRDGRYLLLVGKKVFPRKRECLSTGELLYLLYDNQKGIVSSSGLSLADLSGIDFTEKLFPGALAETRSENAPPCKVSGG